MFTQRSWRAHHIPKGHTERPWVERVWNKALPLLGSEDRVSRVLWVHSLLVNLKHQSEKRREKQGHSSGRLSRLSRAF